MSVSAGRGQAAICCSQSAGKVSSASRRELVERSRRELAEARLARIGRVRSRAEDQVLRVRAGRDPLDRIGRHPEVERNEDESRPHRAVVRRGELRRRGRPGEDAVAGLRGRRHAAATPQAGCAARARGTSRQGPIPHHHRAPAPADRRIARRRRRTGPGGWPSSDGKWRRSRGHSKCVTCPAMPLVAYFAICRTPTPPASAMPTMQPTASARNTRNSARRRLLKRARGGFDPVRGLGYTPPACRPGTHVRGRRGRGSVEPAGREHDATRTRHTA